MHLFIDGANRRLREITEWTESMIQRPGTFFDVVQWRLDAREYHFRICLYCRQFEQLGNSHRLECAAPFVKKLSQLHATVRYCFEHF